MSAASSSGLAAVDHNSFFPEAHLDGHDPHHDFIFGSSMAHAGEAHSLGSHAAGVDEHAATSFHSNDYGFEIPPDSVLEAMKAVMEGQDERFRAQQVAPKPGPGSVQAAVEAANAAQQAAVGAAGQAAPDQHLRVAQSGFHIDLSGLKMLKTAVLVTGGMCSKLFGIGMMGFLVFQSFKTNQQQQQQQQQSPYARMRK